LINVLPNPLIDALLNSSWNADSDQLIRVFEGEMQYIYWFGGTLNLELRDWASAQRGANDMCFNRGFVSGYFTGNRKFINLSKTLAIKGKGGKVADRRLATYLFCVAEPEKSSAKWKDVSLVEINSTAWGFTYINSVNWAQARRAATDLCKRDTRFVGGYFNGYESFEKFFGTINQDISLKGLICYSNGSYGQNHYEAPASEINSGPWPLGDLNTVHWAQAARAATDYCQKKGSFFKGGFMTGHQSASSYGLVCLN
jgi:hypothetical protein